MALSTCGTVKVLHPLFIIPALFQAIDSIVSPNKVVWSIPKDVMPATSVFLQILCYDVPWQLIVLP